MNTLEICKKCHGVGITRERTIKLAHPCPVCKGEGHTDWISNLSQQESNESSNLDTLTKTAYENVNFLVGEIKYLLGEVGIRANVDIQVTDNLQITRHKNIDIFKE